MYSIPTVLKERLGYRGVTFSPGHGLGSFDADMKIISNDTQNGVTDTTAYSIDKAYKLPTMIGVGVMWNHNNQWKVGFDYSLQKWGSLGYPSFDGTNYALAKWHLQG